MSPHRAAGRGRGPAPTVNLLADARRRLVAAGVPDADESARILLEETLGVDRAGLLRRADLLSAAEAARFEALVARRAAREPLQHIVGRWPFLELELRVDHRALIPRPETEDLALLARERLPRAPGALAIDVGTGSGCLALALAASHPDARIVALDASAAALSLARENAVATGLHDRVRWSRGDLLGPVRAGAGAAVIVANLPYVAAEEWEGLQPEVRDHDPREALVAADRGLALIRELASQAPPRLAPGGWLLLEMAPAQTLVVAGEMASCWESVDVFRDHEGRPRIVAARN